jgi:LPS sulfotransferase NodH
LGSLGSAGNPFEHLWDPEGTNQEPLSERWPKVVEAGKGDNGVFGLKLMWYQAERLERELPELNGMPGESLKATLAALLDDPRFIYLTRRDLVRQAISLVRAMQSGRWRSMDAAAAGETYDRQAISEALLGLKRDQEDWESFFSRNAIQPYRLTYEALFSDLPAAIGDLLGWLGHSAVDLSFPETKHERQADSVTEEWIRAFRAS